MITAEAQRTLVKSPPELWSELSDAAALARHLGELGDLSITRLEPETRVEWSAGETTGTIEIKPSAWGTRVKLTVARESPAAQPVADPGAAAMPAAAPAAELPPAIQIVPETPAASGTPHPSSPAPGRVPAAATWAAQVRDAAEADAAFAEAADDGAAAPEQDLETAVPEQDLSSPSPAPAAPTDPSEARQGAVSRLLARLFTRRRRTDAEPPALSEAAHEPTATEYEPPHPAGGHEPAATEYEPPDPDDRHMDAVYEPPAEAAEEEPDAAYDPAQTAGEQVQGAYWPAGARAEPTDAAPQPARTGQQPEEPHTPVALPDASAAETPAARPQDLAAELRAAEEQPGAAGSHGCDASEEQTGAARSPGSDAELTALLGAMLDRLGTAHHRPFSRA